MDSGDSKTPEVERRGSQRLSARLSAQGDQDDAYLQAMVSDGFRPTLPEISPSPASSSRASYVSEESVTPPSSIPSQRTPVAAPPSPPTRPSSIAKPPVSMDSFALQHDGGAASTFASRRQLSRQSSMSTSSIATRSTDSMPPLRQEAPYQGPSGPSHPYQMYPQDVRLARTMSVATSSTAEPVAAEQPYSGPNGPTHPYGLYAQNTVLPDNTAGPSAGSVTVVGFPGVATDNYRRRIGPDGEDMADLIGPDGHTEELPPYTRYPDEQYSRKVRDVEAGQAAHALQPSQPSSSSSSSSAQISQHSQQQPLASSTAAPAAALGLAPQPIPGAGGIGMAARNPEFDSVDDLNTPRSRMSTRSFMSASVTSQHEINTAAAAVVSEKERPLKRWQKFGRRRCCGIVPYWAIFLTLVIIVVMGIIMGAVVGTFVSKQHKKSGKDRDKDNDPDSGSSTYDAVPVPSPSDLPDLPLGIYSMPLVMQPSPNVCFSDPSQTQAWSCNIIYGFAAAMSMTISRNEVGSPYSISMASNDSLTISHGVYSYGTQPPILKGTYTLQTVNDTLEPARGTAWFKMLPFNKTVIIPEENLSATTSSSKLRRRSAYSPPAFPPPPTDLKRKFSAQPGDKPWICTWPDTVLEIFIYPKQNASLYKITSDRNSAAAAANSVVPTVTTRLGSFPFQTSSTPSADSGAITTSTSPATTPSGTTVDSDFAAQLPSYPRVVKLEERRIQGTDSPVCRQVRIQSDGSTTPVLDSSGNAIQITITEVGNSLSTTDRATSRPRRHTKERSVYESELFSRSNAALSDCGCLWFST